MKPRMFVLITALLFGQAVRADNGGDLPETGISVRGRVVDAETEQPIESFRVIVGSPYNEIHTTWQGHMVYEHTGGQFQWRTDRAWRRSRLRIEADGYRPSISPTLRQGAGYLSMTFRMRKSSGFDGVVLDANGLPVVDAQVAMTTQTYETIVEKGVLSYANGTRLGAKIVHTDDQGRFRLSAESDPYLIVAAHRKFGFAVYDPGQRKKSANQTVLIKLQPWCRIEGTCTKENGDPDANAEYSFNVGWQKKPEWPVLGHNYDARTDDQGRFVCRYVAPGQHYLQRRQRTAGGAQTIGFNYDLVAVSGKTIRLNVGEQRRTVVGRLSLRDDGGDRFKWTDVVMMVRLERNRNAAKPRAKIPVAADGTFRIEDLTPGKYEIVLGGKQGTQAEGWVLRQPNYLTLPLVDQDQAKIEHDWGDVFVYRD